MKCDYFENNECRSCQHIQQPLERQLATKSQQLRGLLAEFEPLDWLPPVVSAPAGFRNKAKMVALGAAHAPLLGLLSPSGKPVSLCDCSLYPPDMQQLLHRLEVFVRQAGIPPYNIAKSKGELKFILLTRSQSRAEFMLRFVLRSTLAIERINKVLPELLADFPHIKVVSVNIQPVHMAILEGETEIFLSDATRLEERFNDVPLFIRPKSFFQTNPMVAAKLYQTGREWISALSPNLVWDLFCGVGGFGLHCASPATRLIGIEIESEAIACAQLSANQMRLKNIEFRALDSTDFAIGQSAQDKPDVIIVNPPRRGIGAELCRALNEYSPEAILYSSCNAKTLAQDLKELSDYQVNKVQLFDMFPHTDHFEVLVLLLKASGDNAVND